MNVEREPELHTVHVRR